MDSYNKCLKFPENPKSGSQVCKGLVTPLATALACPGSYFLSTERRFEYCANCEISISWWRLLQIAKPVDYIYCGVEVAGDTAGSLQCHAGAASSSEWDQWLWLVSGSQDMTCPCHLSVQHTAVVCKPTQGFLPCVCAKWPDLLHRDANAVSVSTTELLSKSAQTLPGRLWQQLLMTIYAFEIFLSASVHFQPGFLIPVIYVYSLLPRCRPLHLSVLFLKNVL